MNLLKQKTIFKLAAFLAVMHPAMVLAKNHTATPIIMDVDTGRDDAWALLSVERDCRLDAVVASYGNVPLALAAQNSADVVALGRTVAAPACQKKKIPVWYGESHPLMPVPETSLAEIVRRAAVNGNGLCNLVLPDHSGDVVYDPQDWALGVKRMIEKRGKINYVVAGPLTNLAHLIDVFGYDTKGQPNILRHINKLVVMGGSFAPDLAVDFNFLADPAAAQKVIKIFGVKMLVVPYDETRKLHLTMEEITTLLPQDKAAAFSRDLMVAYAQGWSKNHDVLLHDPATLLALAGDMKQVRERVTVILSGDKAGKTMDAADGTDIMRVVIPAGDEVKLRDRLLQKYMRMKLGATVALRP